MITSSLGDLFDLRGRFLSRAVTKEGSSGDQIKDERIHRTFIQSFNQKVWSP